MSNSPPCLLVRLGSRLGLCLVFGVELRKNFSISEKIALSVLQLDLFQPSAKPPGCLQGLACSAACVVNRYAIPLNIVSALAPPTITASPYMWPMRVHPMDAALCRCSRLVG